MLIAQMEAGLMGAKVLAAKVLGGKSPTYNFPGAKVRGEQKSGGKSPYPDKILRTSKSLNSPTAMHESNQISFTLTVETHNYNYVMAFSGFQSQTKILIFVPTEPINEAPSILFYKIYMFNCLYIVYWN